jgi:hypothetical protein
MQLCTWSLRQALCTQGLYRRDVCNEVHTHAALQSFQADTRDPGSSEGAAAWGPPGGQAVPWLEGAHVQRQQGFGAGAHQRPRQVGVGVQPEAQAVCGGVGSCAQLRAGCAQLLARGGAAGCCQRDQQLRGQLQQRAADVGG